MNWLRDEYIICTTTFCYSFYYKLAKNEERNFLGSWALLFKYFFYHVYCMKCELQM